MTLMVLMRLLVLRLLKGISCRKHHRIRHWIEVVKVHSTFADLLQLCHVHLLQLLVIALIRLGALGIDGVFHRVVSSFRHIRRNTLT